MPYLFPEIIGFSINKYLDLTALKLKLKLLGGWFRLGVKTINYKELDLNKNQDSIELLRQLLLDDEINRGISDSVDLYL